MEYVSGNDSIPEPYGREKTAEKGFRLRGILLLSAVTGVFLLILFYTIMAMGYRGTYFPKTMLNGMDASGMSPEELAQAIIKKSDQYYLALIERDGKQEKIDGGKIDLRVEVRAENLAKILEKQDTALWIFRAGKRKEYQAEISVHYDETLLQKAIKELTCMDASQMKAPVSARTEYAKDSGYRIIPEIMGNQVKKKRLGQEIRKALALLQDTVKLEEKSCYEMPEVRESDERLKEKVRVLNQYLDMTVTYRFGDRKEVLDGAEISRWLRFGRDGKISANLKQIQQYVKGLADTYDTAYKSRNFKTSYGPVVRIHQGDYGFQIDQKKETEALEKIVLSGRSRAREPVYIQRAASRGAADYGDTYVEINLETQHLFLYKDGRRILDTDFVSGNLSKGYGTPCGIYGITYKQRNAVLKGADYRSKVSYWMPFNRGIGLHDASWRTKFGGDIYRHSGSHGCINLPPEKAKEIFRAIQKGTPVICYAMKVTKKQKKKAIS